MQKNSCAHVFILREPVKFSPLLLFGGLVVLKCLHVALSQREVVFTKDKRFRQFLKSYKNLFDGNWQGELVIDCSAYVKIAVYLNAL